GLARSQPRGLRPGERVEAPPLIRTKQLQQLAAHFGEISVMTQPRFQRRARDARLVRVDLPGMEIEDRGATLALVDPTDRPGRNGIGQQPEKAAARDEAAPGDLGGGDGNLDQRGIIERLPGEAWRIPPAVMIVR